MDKITSLASKIILRSAKIDKQIVGTPPTPTYTPVRLYSCVDVPPPTLSSPNRILWLRACLRHCSFVLFSPLLFSIAFSSSSLGNAVFRDAYGSKEAWSHHTLVHCISCACIGEITTDRQQLYIHIVFLSSTSVQQPKFGRLNMKHWDKSCDSINRKHLVCSRWKDALEKSVQLLCWWSLRIVKF